MEERAGERRRFKTLQKAPLPDPLPTRASWGEGVGRFRFKNSVKMRPVQRLIEASPLELPLSFEL
jgi:hypothetical protein